MTGEEVGRVFEFSVDCMDARMAWAAAQMERQLDDPLPIATLAAEVHLSPSRFAHLFRRHVGTSPAQYLHVLRMERARLLLEQTFLSVKEVMSLVGCNDASHFSRDFRRFHGINPRACRAAATERSARRGEDEREVRRGHGQPPRVQHVCDLLLGARRLEPEVSDLERAVAALLATLDLVKSTAGLANEQQDAPRDLPPSRPAPDLSWEVRSHRR